MKLQKINLLSSLSAKPVQVHPSFLLSSSSIKYEHRGRMEMTLIPIKRSIVSVIVPSRVTSSQWISYWGTTKVERLQKIMESILLSYGGAWLAWFLSFMVGSFISSIVGSCLVFNWMYSPILFASTMNNNFLKSYQGKHYHYSILAGKIIR